MLDGRRIKRNFRLNMAIAAAAGLLPVATAGADVIFDNATTGLDTLVAGGQPNWLGPTAKPGTFIGGGYQVSAGAADIYGFDAFPWNLSTAPYSYIEVNLYVWGTVNTTGTVSTTNRAFGDLLGHEVGEVYFGPSGLGAGGGIDIADYDFSYTNGFFTLQTPIVLPSTTIGITLQYQGSNDGVNFQTIPSLTSPVPYVDPPDTGTSITNGFYRNDATQTNPTEDVDGNFSTPIDASSQPNASGPMFRLYGDVGALTPDQWLNSTGGSWTDPTQWSRGAIPTPGIDAIFNLSSSTQYIVTVPDFEQAANIRIQNDNVAFDLFTGDSYLDTGGLLTVGQSPTAGGTTHGLLTLMNSNAGPDTYSIMEAGSIVVGGNGGTGTLTATSSVFLYSDNDTQINANSSLVLNGANFSTGTLTLAGTTNHWTGKLDIGNSDVSIRNGTLATVMNQIKQGYNNGHWNGSGGITSSAAAADTTHLTAIGVIVNDDGTGTGSPIYGSNSLAGPFNNVDTDPGDGAILLRYTYYGDANLDGSVDASDYALIDNGFLNHLTGWYNGDFNYDGVVDGSDYALIDNSFNTQGSSLNPFSGSDAIGSGSDAPIDSRLFGTAIDANGEQLSTDTEVASPTVEIAATPSASAVPEPATLGLLAMAALPMLGRRTRRSGRRSD